MDPGSESAPKPFPLPPQHNLLTATKNAVGRLRGQSEEQLLWLGAKTATGALGIPVLGTDLKVDVSTGGVSTSDGDEVSPMWRILVLHYLCVSDRAPKLEPEITFADLASAMSYVGVYKKRVLDRLCGTVGADAQRLKGGAEALGAVEAQGGDIAFELVPFPRIRVRLIWHAPDEEFPPSATMLFPRNVESFFCTEDIVVLSERLVSRLAGGSF